MGDMWVRTWGIDSVIVWIINMRPHLLIGHFRPFSFEIEGPHRSTFWLHRCHWIIKYFCGDAVGPSLMGEIWVGTWGIFSVMALYTIYVLDKRPHVFMSHFRPFPLEIEGPHRSTFWLRRCHRIKSYFCGDDVGPALIDEKVIWFSYQAFSDLRLWDRRSILK